MASRVGLMINPRVSVCIPTYNRATPLRQTIEALLNQTISNFELIICDDASLDNTEDVVRSFRDERIIYHRNEVNLGLYPNWHKCIDLASGEYIAIYHDHDIYMPTIVERSVTLLDRCPTASFVHTALFYLDEKDKVAGVDIRAFGELTPGDQVIDTLSRSWSSPIMAATAMVRREAYDQVGLYRYKEYGLGCDLDMWFRLCRIGDMAYIHTPQALIRLRTKDQPTAQFSWKNLVKGMQMRRDHINLALKANWFRLYKEMALYSFQRDMRLIACGVRAVLFEPPDVIVEGERIMQAHASAWTVLLFKIVKKSVYIQRLLIRCFLPVHYRKVERNLGIQRSKALEYMKTKGMSSLDIEAWFKKLGLPVNSLPDNYL